jgi:L-threonylcarbamoyladenylate synthase
MNIENATDDALACAAKRLQAGGLVAFPTETVYGLGADATQDRAVAAIFAAKGRPSFNPLIVHVSDAASAREWTVWNMRAEMLAAAFWPGPLTLVLPRPADSRISLLASAGGDTLAVRVPSHPVAQRLLALARCPVAAPSANRSGRISPTLASHVRAELGDRVDLILDGGPCQTGIESSVVDISRQETRLLRPGFVTREQIEAVLGAEVTLGGGSSGALHSPGLLESHYAPSLPVRLNVVTPYEGEIFLVFGPGYAQRENSVQLSETGDLVEAAARLFAALRECDQPRYTGIAVSPVPDTGIGVAINDRLRRAAAGRGTS